jgi:hypothetical protein
MALNLRSYDRNMRARLKQLRRDVCQCGVPEAPDDAKDLHDTAR